MPNWSRRAFVALAAAAMVVAVTATSAFADKRNFTVVNNSPIVFAHLYVAATDSESWEEDILGKDVLGPGESWDITFSKYDGEAGKCLYDVKVVGKGGEEGKLLKVDLCTVTTVTFSGNAAPPAGPTSRALIETWLTANPTLGDPATTNIDWQTSPDGRTTIVAMGPKGDTNSPVKGVNIAIGQENGAAGAATAIAGIADVRKADGWQVDTTPRPSLPGRAYASGGKAVEGGMITLFAMVQANDRVILVSATGLPDASEAMGGFLGTVLVDLLKTVDPTAR